MLLQVYYLEKQKIEAGNYKPTTEGGEYLLGQMFAMLSRHCPAVFFGPAAKRCEELGVIDERFYHFCRSVDGFFMAYMASETPGAMAGKLQPMEFLREFITAIEKKEIEGGVDIVPLTDAQFYACLEMMQHAGFVQRVKDCVLHIKSFTSV